MRVKVALLLGVFLCLYAPGVDAADDPLFTMVDLRLNYPVEAAVATPLIRAGQNTLLVLGKKKGSGRPVFTILSPGADGTWNAPHKNELTISKDGVFYDLVSTGGKARTHIAVLTPQGVRFLDPESGDSMMEIPVTSIYRHGGNPDFGRQDFARDVNGDDRDDLVVPDFNVVHIFLQQEDGSFTSGFDLPFATEMRIGLSQFDLGEAPRYQAFPLSVIDTNLDGKDDIAFLKGRDIVSFEQQEDGSYSITPHVIPIPLDIVGNTWAEVRAAQNASANESNYRQTRIVGFDDFDGDGLSDILTREEDVDGTFDRLSTYNIHFGRDTGTGLGFGKEVDTLVAIEGLVPTFSYKKITGDDRFDAMFASAEFGIGKIIGILITKSTKFDLSFYEMGEDRRFRDKANLVKKLSVDFDFSSGSVDIPVFMTADVSGDGRDDLILNDKDRGLEVFFGEAKERLFEKKGREFRVDLPKDGQLVRSDDVDGDGRDDLLIRFNAHGQDGAENRRRLILLLAKEPK